MTGDKVPYWEYGISERRYREIFGMYPMDHYERMSAAAERYGIPEEEISSLHSRMVSLTWQTFANAHEKEQERERIRRENDGFYPPDEDIPF